MRQISKSNQPMIQNLSALARALASPTLWPQQLSFDRNNLNSFELFNQSGL